MQGLDYTYTIHGWLKAINHPVLDPNADPGADGPNGTAQDAFGMSLGYYQGDYKNNEARYQSLSATTDALIDRNLYNGNIAAWASDAQENALAAQQGNLKYTGLTGQQYQYDELNRLVGSTFRQYQNGSWQSPASAGEYSSSYSYDASGNLQTLNRNAFGSNPLIDRLQYHYQAGTNKLDYVTDAAEHPTIRDDFQPGQRAGNYDYDKIGNLTKDEQEGITSIAWTVYGKVQQITKQDGSETTYRYDATGNRSSKQHTNAEGQQETTYYVRDASGNVMAIYQASGEQRCLAGQISATKRYDPSVWEDGQLSLSGVQSVYLPQEIQVTAGSSGNHQLTMYYTDENNTEQTVLYQGGASASHAYNKAGTTRNEGQYQQGQRYVFQSSSNGVVADELVQVQSVRVSINNGDSWDPSGQTSVLVKLYEPCAGLTLAEQPIYGSERLGIYRAEKLLSQEPDEVTATGEVAYITGDISISAYENINEYVLAEGVEMTVGKDFSFSYAEQQQEFSIRFGEVETQGQYYARETGKKHYELKDHLGNLRVLVSDRKLAEDTDGDGVAESSKAEVVASYEYYSFGMLQPGRTYFGSSSNELGFNGMRRSNEISSNHYTTKFRELDTRLGGRWWSIDPKSRQFPGWSPYAFSFNSPILLNDPDGDCPPGVNCDNPLPNMERIRVNRASNLGPGSVRSGGTRFHNGHDLYAASGTEVRSVMAGEVIHSGFINGYGNSVTVQHTVVELNAQGGFIVDEHDIVQTQTYYSFYSHLGDVNVSVGDRLAVGQRIGESGTSGNAEGLEGVNQHLHFELGTGLQNNGLLLDRDFLVDPNIGYNGVRFDTMDPYSGNAIQNRTGVIKMEYNNSGETERMTIQLFEGENSNGPDITFERNENER